MVKLIEACWNSNPAHRPSVKAARFTLEKEIIKDVGEFEMSSDGTSTISNSSNFKGTQTGHVIVPPPISPLVLVVARVADAVQVLFYLY